MEPNISEVSTDVLIIGGGAAACSAAIEAAKFHCKVTLVDKGVLGRSGSSPTSGAAIAVPIGHEDPTDNPDLHFRDSIEGGAYVNDPNLIRIVVDEGSELVKTLEEVGVQFIRSKKGGYLQNQGLGHSYPRSVSPKGGSMVVMAALRKEVFARGVQVHERQVVLSLLKSRDRVVGAVAISLREEDLTVYRARTVVLAAGSATGLFKYRSANYVTTGDGYVLAYREGARLANQEFGEFTVIPKIGDLVISSNGISPFVGTGTHIINAAGERFLQRYDSARMERTTRARLVQAVFTEMVEGRGPVYNDARHFDQEMWEKMESKGMGILVKLKSLGLDYKKDLFEWVPALHTCLGGAIMNERAQTDVPGLYAAGEGTNVQGANRLSGNAWTQCLVFGRRAGRYAALEALQDRSPLSPIQRDEVRRIAGEVAQTWSDQGVTPVRLVQEIRDVCWNAISVARSQEGILQGLERLAEIKERRIKVTNHEQLIAAFDVKNLLAAGEMISKAALARTETRGQHYRTDFPNLQDPEWRRWIVIHDADGRMEVSLMPIPQLVDKYPQCSGSELL